MHAARLLAAVGGAEAAAAGAAALAAGEALGPADVGAVVAAQAEARAPVAQRLALPSFRHRHRASHLSCGREQQHEEERGGDELAWSLHR